MDAGKGNGKDFQEPPELKMLRRELENEKNRHLRTLADFDNYRKRVERDAEIRNNEAKKDFVLDLLTLLDNFEQARQQISDKAAAEGIDLIYRQFLELLKKNGVDLLDCVGKPFDPVEQEGIAYTETADYPEGYVAKEISKGYSFGEKILRPARVIVAKKLP